MTLGLIFLMFAFTFFCLWMGMQIEKTRQANKVCHADRARRRRGLGSVLSDMRETTALINQQTERMRRENVRLAEDLNRRHPGMPPIKIPRSLDERWDQ